MSWKRIIGVLFTAAVAFGTGTAPAHAQSSTATVNYSTTNGTAIAARSAASISPAFA